MLKLIFTAGIALLLANSALAFNRKQLLQICSDQSRTLIKNDILSKVPPGTQYFGLTSWLSGENVQDNVIKWKYAHISRFKLPDGQYMSWDYVSMTQPTNEGCRILSYKKVSETKLLPPCEDDNSCEPDHDNETDFVPLKPLSFIQTQQCFYKHEGITHVPNSEYLPEKVCFSNLNVATKNKDLQLYIEGDPISGVFPLELIQTDGKVQKYMTYIFSKTPHKNQNKSQVTLRVSVDLLKDTTQIDYIYLAAEFFVYYDDSSDTHI